jgi:hypothetical protein
LGLERVERPYFTLGGVPFRIAGVQHLVVSRDERLIQIEVFYRTEDAFALRATIALQSAAVKYTLIDQYFETTSRVSIVTNYAADLPVRQDRLIGDVEGLPEGLGEMSLDQQGLPLELSHPGF